MGHVVQRFGFRITRGWAVLLLVAGGLIAAAFWVGPLRPLPAELQLLALADGSATTAVAAIPQRDTVTGTIRFAVPLAIRNVGAQAARPRRIMISVPAQFRLVTHAGPLAPDVTPGVPLRRYAINLPLATVPADSSLRSFAVIDTLWIEPDVHAYYCTLDADNVPEFVPAPARNADALSDVRMFYSIRTAADERHSGILAVRVNPEALRVQPAAMPPAFRTTIGTDTAALPSLGVPIYSGARTAHCGDPEQPIELYTVQWQIRDGGRLYIVYVDGQARKHLYDLTGDGVIDLETWDIDGDGRFEARREARFRTPEFLIPQRPRLAELLTPDPEAPDSAWLAVFRATSRGVGRFTDGPPVRAPRDTVVADTLLGDTLPADTLVADTLAADTLAAPGPVVDDTAGVTPPTPEWLELFTNTAAGPFRFTRPTATAADTAEAGAPVPLGRQIDTPRARPVPPPGAGGAGQDTIRPRPRPDTTRGPVPLGRPVVRPPPDTLGVS